MKSIFSKLLITSCFVHLMGKEGQSQIRSIDFEPIINSPTEGQVLDVGEQFIFQVSIVNHGPDIFLDGDSIFLKDNAIAKSFMIILGRDIGLGDTVAIFQDVPRHFTTSYPAFNFCTFLFDDPSTQISIGNNPVAVSYIDPNPTNNNTCVDITINPAATEVKELNQGDIDFSFEIYPNPAYRETSIDLNLANDGNIILFIRDLTGRIIMEKEFDKRSKYDKTPLVIRFPNVTNGMYMLELNTSGQRIAKKLIILN